MTTRKYRIYVKGILSFVKHTEKDFDAVCSAMNKLNVKYTTEIIDLI